MYTCKHKRIFEHFQIHLRIYGCARRKPIYLQNIVLVSFRKYKTIQPTKSSWINTQPQFHNLFSSFLKNNI